MRIAPKVIVSTEQRAQLESWAKGRRVPVRLAQRARIVLLAADGQRDLEIADELDIGRRNAARWRQRFLDLGIAGIERDAPRPGRKRRISDRTLKKIVRMTTQMRPANATHWSTRSMAQTAKVSEASVRRIWHAHGLKPHLVNTFKVSNDRHFSEKLQDIVGLYLDPPEHALVLCCDEKSQIQALDRTQPGLPLKKGRAQSMTHDYKRNGTTTLFAALNTLDGNVIGQCMRRHRHQEWLRSLNTRAFTCTSRPPAPLGSTWWSDSSATCQSSNCSAASFPTLLNWSKPLSTTSSNTIVTRSPLSGPLAPLIFSQKSCAHVRGSISSNLFDALH